MENKIKNRKYLLEKLIDCKFLKYDETLKISKEKTIEEYLFLEYYSEKEIKEFLDFIISLKKDDNKKLIEYKEKIKIAEPKQKNHFFYDELLEGGLDKDLDVFLTELENKILEKNKSFIRMQKIKYALSEIEIIRKKIRSESIVKEEFKGLLKEKSYLEKINDLEKMLKEILNKYKNSFNQEIIFREIYWDMFVQVMTYDIFHNSISKDKRDLYFTECVKFFEELEEKIDRKIKGNDLKKEERKNIFEDFYNFIFLREGLLEEREILEVAEKLERRCDIKYRPLSLRIQFYEMVSEYLKYADNYFDSENITLTGKYLRISEIQKLVKLKYKKNINIDLLESIGITVTKFEISIKELKEILKSLKRYEKKNFQMLSYDVKLFEELSQIYEKEKEEFYSQPLAVYLFPYLDLEEVREKVNKEISLISLKDAKEIIENFKLTKTEKSKLLYNQDKIKKNFDKENENITEMLKKLNLYGYLSLQLRKGIVSIIEKDKKIIKPFRKTLKSLIAKEEFRNSKIVKSHFRIRVTKEMYKEKGTEEEFYSCHKVQAFLLNILIKIYSEKNSSFREELADFLIGEVLNFFKEIYKDKNTFVMPEL